MSPNDENRGTRAKKVVSVGDRAALFKYDNGAKFRGSEDCSEKIASEFAKVLGYKTAEIDLAEGENGERGLLSYLFVDTGNDEEHIDAESFLGIKDKNEEPEKYTIENIRGILHDKYPTIPFDGFIKIIVFDALVGESDRHGGNWGITRTGQNYSISCLYDTATCLLRDFNNENFIAKFDNGTKNFAEYVNKNKMAICKEDGNGQYQPPDSVIDYLPAHYKEATLAEIKNLDEKLTDNAICDIVHKIPNSRMGERHKDYVIKYVKMQKDKIIQKGVKK